MRINPDHSIFITKKRLNSPIVSTFVVNIKIMAPKRRKVID